MRSDVTGDDEDELRGMLRPCTLEIVHMDESSEDESSDDGDGEQ